MAKAKRKHPRPVLWLFLILLFLFVSMTLANTAVIPPEPDETEPPPFLSFDTTEDGEPAAEYEYERREGVYTFLVIGRDRVALNTDVLFLVSYDTEKQTAAAAQIPRDTYCDGGRINRLFAVYYAEAQKNGTDDLYGAASGRLLETVSSVFSVRVDYYVTVGIDAFREIVDAVGGVDIDVPCDMDYDDPAQGLSIHLSKGKQHLDGAVAEQFVRFRHDYVQGDIGRVDAQKLFLTAFFTQIQEKFSPLSLPKLVKAVSGGLVTDLTADEILYFAGKARSLSPDALTMFTFPGTAARRNGDSGAWLYILSRPACRKLVNAYLNVYDSSLPASLFDRDNRLTEPDNPYLCSLSEADITEEVHTAAEIEENGIKIAVIP